MSLDQDTLSALDWPVVVDALATCASTPIGREAVENIEALPSAAAVRNCFDTMDELLALQEEGEHLRLGGIADIRTTVRASAKGRVLEGSELKQIGDTMGAMRDVSWFLTRNAEENPRLWDIGNVIYVDDVLADELLMAFEPNGDLSARTYPELGELRARIEELHSGIRSTLQRLLKSDDMRELLQDEFVTQRNERYVLPIKAHAKRWDIGIVHGTSGSGQTAYIEPTEVVNLNNKLRIAEGDLKTAERRILTRLSASVGRESEALLADLRAITDLDLIATRCEFARTIDAIRPTVGDRGTIMLLNARHPVLVLRGVDVIGNDLSLSSEQPALLLSGPNAGGKTVSLKTMGLCALLARIGCFIPADAGSQVDHFSEVLAAIGDSQSVEADLSSFSGHLLVLREMVDRAAPQALILLDEIASGTDPAEGAPLAQAVLETLISRDARVVVTTHFARLKLLPAADDRFGAAAVEYADGRPTYRVVSGALGQSHALSIAAEMGLGPAVLDRARELLSDGDRGLTATVAGLEAMRADADAEKRRHQALSAELKERLREISNREHILKTRAKALEEEAAAQFKARVSSAEKAISAVISQLQKNPSHRAAAAAKSTIQALQAVLPEETPKPSPPSPETITVGQTVRLPGTGGIGQVTRIQGKKAHVSVGSVVMRVELARLAIVHVEAAPKPKKPKAPPKRRKKNKKSANDGPPLEQAVRFGSNTLDLRGQRVEEGLDAVDTFLDRAIMGGLDIVFILHGHGTGAMKQAVRQHVRRSDRVLEWSPANADQGGDAYTIARVGG